MKIHAETLRQERRDANEKVTSNHPTTLRFSLRFASVFISLRLDRTPRQDAVAGERHENHESNFFSFKKPTALVLIPKPQLGNAANPIYAIRHTIVT
ncbi:MAG: hypothetical protein H8E22_02375 [Candidatus Cloacimonetes bacterium]|nr:hypothetical protein [Candidatus Cloacimonadota bacterium]